MAFSVLDRLLTVVVTATVTSAVWIVAGSVYFVQPETGPAAPLALPPQASPPAPAVAAAANSEVAAAGLRIPVEGVTFSQLRDTFAETRDGGARPHEALDIMAPRGTPVIAAAAGTIEKLFRSDAGGKTIYVRSTDRTLIYYYAHLDAYAAGIEEGQHVRRGERLGTVGSTGNADPAAPHLHFAMMRTRAGARWWDTATAINPYHGMKGDVSER